MTDISDKSKPIDLLSDNGHHDGQQVDTATIVAAKSFADFSIKAPFAVVAAIEAKVAQALATPDGELFIRASNITANTAVTAEEKSKAQQEKFRDGMAVIEAEDKRQRERDEWAKTTSTFGNVTMTGAEWQAFSDDLKGDTPLRRWMIERLQKDGKTVEEAHEFANTMSVLLAIQAMPEGDRTEEQKKQLNEANKNPEIQSILLEAKEKRIELASTRAVAAEQVTGAEQSKSTKLRASELVDFASAPILSQSYQTALATEKPLENSTKSDPAKPTPPILQSSGFDF